MKKIRNYLKQITVLKRCVLFLRTLYRFNFLKTVYINFKLFPFKTAIKLPIWVYGRIRIISLKGQVHIESPIETRMIKIGINEENIGNPSAPYLLNIKGSLLFKGFTTFSINGCLIVEDGAKLEIGEFCFFGNSVRIICIYKIILGSFLQLTFESQIFDTDFHYTKNISTGEIKPMMKEIIIGDYNWIGNRTSIMKGTKTPNYCIVASNSLLNKDYTNLNKKCILLAGSPAKCIKENIVRIFSPIEGKYYPFFYDPANHDKSFFESPGLPSINLEKIKEAYRLE